MAARKTSSRKYPYPGTMCGEWEVLRSLPAQEGKKSAVTVKCSCGVERAVAVASLTSGASRSCGHTQAEASRKASRQRAVESSEITGLGRKCTYCALWKTWDEFYYHPTGLNKKASGCIECTRKNNMKRMYNLTTEDYDRLSKAQKGLCALCPEAGTLSLDHDHACCPGSSNSCGKCIRGLLCQTCNFMLGPMERDIERFASIHVKEYLERRPFA